MKIFLTLAALATFSAPAFAAPITCKSVDAGIDNGTYATFSSDRRQVEISVVTISGSEVVARLECYDAIRRTPNWARNRLVTKCAEPVIREGGYSLGLRRGSAARKYTAVVNTVTIAGEEKFADLTCVSAMN